MEIFTVWLFTFISNKNALKRRRRLCDDNDYYHVEMPTKDNKTLNATMEKNH